MDDESHGDSLWEKLGGNTEAGAFVLRDGSAFCLQEALIKLNGGFLMAEEAQENLGNNIPKVYDPQSFEKKWYKFWEDNKRGKTLCLRFRVVIF